MSFVFCDHSFSFMRSTRHKIRLGWCIVGVWMLSFMGGVSFGYAYEEIQVKNGGRIVGNVKFAGVVPSPKRLDISKDKEICGKTEKFDQSLVIGEEKGLQNVLVSLLDIQAGKKFPAEKRVLDQRECVYDPHIIVVPVGRSLSILNNDGVLHSLHTHSVRNPAFNKAQSKFKKETQVTFSFPEIIQLTCDVHSWMSGWIVVSEHPYYVVSGRDGAFELTDVPAGEYKLRFWHEILGEKKVSVVVNEGDVSKVQFWVER